MRRLFTALATVLGLASAAPAPADAIDLTKLDQEDLLYLELKTGRVVIMLRPDKAPNHCARIKELARKGFYDGLKFHRVIEGFMAQTGDPLGNGTGGSGKDLKAEFNSLRHMRGTVSMARSGHPDSADSQFFIMLAPNFGLDGQYTVWGRVIDGMAHVDAIKKGNPNDNGAVGAPDSIVSLRVAADVDGD